jgi:hypothetical protein
MGLASGNILLTGGNTKFPQFKKRFYNEIRPLIPDIYPVIYIYIYIYIFIYIYIYLYIHIYMYMYIYIPRIMFCYICIFYNLYVDSLTYAFGWSTFLCRIRFCDTLVVIFLSKHHHLSGSCL